MGAEGSESNKTICSCTKTAPDQKFNEGVRTGKKYKPHEVATQMRRDPQFSSKDGWLTWTQIASFSRLSQKHERTSVSTTPEPSGDEDYDLEEIADDPYANAFNEHIDEAIQTVVDEVMSRE